MFLLQTAMTTIDRFTALSPGTVLPSELLVNDTDVQNTEESHAIPFKTPYSIEPTTSHTATVLLLHGVSNTAHELYTRLGNEIIRLKGLEHVRWVFVQAYVNMSLLKPLV